MRSLRIAGVLLALCIGTHAKAQNTPSSETLEAAREFFALVSPDMITQLSSASTTEALQQIEKLLAGRIDRDTLNELRVEFERVGRESFARVMASTMAEAPALYARHFSAAELRELTAFYRTPTGAKALRVMPQLMPEVLALIMPKIGSVQSEVQTAVEAVLRRRGYGGGRPQ